MAYPSGGSAWPIIEALPFGPMGKRELMGVAEIAARLGVSRSRAAQIVLQKGFPDPAARLIGIVIWEAADVEAWIAKNRPPADDAES